MRNVHTFPPLKTSLLRHKLEGKVSLCLSISRPFNFLLMFQDIYYSCCFGVEIKGTNFVPSHSRNERVKAIVLYVLMTLNVYTQATETDLECFLNRNTIKGVE